MKKKFKDFAKPYPADELLRRAFLESDQWIKYKHLLLANLAAGKDAKKAYLPLGAIMKHRTFSSSLRKEVPPPPAKEVTYSPIGVPKKKLQKAAFARIKAPLKICCRHKK